MDKILNKLLWVSSITLLMVVIIGVGLYLNKGGSIGSVTQGNEYKYASSTGALARQLSARPATLGSVVVVKATAQAFVIWDATSTTDIASTTIVTLPASIAAGTYTFDLQTKRGLKIVPATSFAGEYITTYR